MTGFYFIMFIIFIFVIFIILFIIKIFNNKDKGNMRYESIACNLYGEEHSYSINYYELTGMPKESGGDSYFYDIFNNVPSR